MVSFLEELKFSMRMEETVDGVFSPAESVVKLYESNQVDSIELSLDDIDLVVTEVV